MANVKKTNNVSTTKIIEKKVVAEVKSETQVEPIKQTPPKAQNQKIEIEDRDMIRVINNKVGCLNYSNRLGSVRFEIQEYGLDTYIYFMELRELRSLYPNMVNDGWVIIDNEDVVKLWGLDKKYENIVKPEDVNEFFTLDTSEIREKIKKMNPICQGTIVEVAYQKYMDGTLDSNKVQRTIEDAIGRKIFNTDY